MRKGNDVRRDFPWKLARHWVARYFPLWVLVAAVIFIVQTVLAAVLHDREDLISFIGVLERLPKIFKAFIGGDELMPSSLDSIIAIGYQHPLILTMLMINAVAVPTGLLTAEAERGTMELLLVRPITRTRLYGLTTAIAMTGQAGLVGVVFLGTAVWTRVFDYGEPIPLQGFARVAVNLGAMSCAVAGLSTLAAVCFEERARAIGVVVGYLIASYLLDFSAVWLPRLEFIHPFTLFYYCVPIKVLKAGALPWMHLAVLGSIALGSVGAGWLVWRRRDIHAA